MVLIERKKFFKKKGIVSVKEILRPHDEGHKKKTLQDFFYKVECEYSTKWLKNG